MLCGERGKCDGLALAMILGKRVGCCLECRCLSRSLSHATAWPALSLLLVFCWHLWNIFKVHSPSSLKLVWSVCLFISPRRIRSTSPPQVSRATAQHRIPGKGQNHAEQGRRADLWLLLSLWGRKQRDPHQVSTWDYFMKKSDWGRKGDTFYFWFFHLWPQDSSEGLQRGELKSRNKVATLQPFTELSFHALAVTKELSWTDFWSLIQFVSEDSCDRLVLCATDVEDLCSSLFLLQRINPFSPCILRAEIFLFLATTSKPFHR